MRTVDHALNSATNWLAVSPARLSAFATVCALIGIAIGGGPV